MRIISGVADAKKVMMVGETDDTDVRVIDGKGRVCLQNTSGFSSLTTEQARYLASCLEASANRIDGVSNEKPTTLAHDGG
jgi:methyl coenzyme M reductase beta subunit